MGFGLTLTTFTSGTTIASSPMNTNFSAINNASTFAGSVQWDGNLAATVLLEATVASDTHGSAVHLTCGGVLTLGTSSNAGSITVTGGGITVSGGVSASGASTFNALATFTNGLTMSGGTMTLSGGSGLRVNVGTTQLDNAQITTDGSGNLTVNALILSNGTFSHYAQFSGGGSGTFNHNLGTTPTAMVITYAGNFGTAPTQCIAFYNANGSTVQVAAQSGYSWQGICFR